MMESEKNICILFQLCNLVDICHESFKYRIEVRYIKKTAGFPNWMGIDIIDYFSQGYKC